MLGKLNPRQIISAHWRAFTDDSTGKISKSEVSFHIAFPAILSIAYLKFGDGIGENAAGIIVSAASIAAGLLLNLLVLVYTLVYNAKSASQPIKNLDAFRQVCDESLATIAYSILLSLGLVLAAFCALAAKNSVISLAGQFLTVYLGAATILCILIVLKRVYALVHFEVRR